MAAEKEDKKESKQAKKYVLQTCFGLMVDPTDSAVFTQEPKIIYHINDWMRIQQEAGKLTIAEG